MHCSTSVTLHIKLPHKSDEASYKAWNLKLVTWLLMKQRKTLLKHKQQEKRNINKTKNMKTNNFALLYITLLPSPLTPKTTPGAFEGDGEDVLVSFLWEGQHSHVLLVVGAGTQHHLHCSLHKPLHLSCLWGRNCVGILRPLHLSCHWGRDSVDITMGVVWILEVLCPFNLAILGK